MRRMLSIYVLYQYPHWRKGLHLPFLFSWYTNSRLMVLMRALDDALTEGKIPCRL